MKHSSVSASAGRGRRIPDTPLEDVPSVETSFLKTDEDIRRFENLSAAIGLYYDLKPMAIVLAAAKCSDRNFHRILSNFWSIAADGRPMGYRALIPYARSNESARSKPAPRGWGTGSGFSGVFTMLLRHHPAVEAGLVSYLSRKRKRNLQPNRTTIGRLLEEFLTLCDADGIASDEYPFNTVSKGVNGLRHWFRECYLPKHMFRHVKVEHGDDAATSFGATDVIAPRDYTPRPMRCWQLDEFTVDVQARYETLTEDFVWVSRDAQRATGIVIKDVDGGSVQAFMLVLGAAATASDLLTVFWHAISGPIKVTPAIANLDYAPGGGYPASVVEKLRFALPALIELDNAFAHLADAFRNMLQNVCGIEVVLGKPHKPKPRASIESEIAVLAVSLLHEMPGTTGTGPGDPVRAKADVPVVKRIRTNELAHVLDVYFANKNASRRRGSHYMVVLDRLARYCELPAFDPSYLPVDKRHPHFFGNRQLVRVKVDIAGGRAPFVNAYDRRYRGPALRQFVAHPNQRLVVRSSGLDLRTVQLFDLSGADLGPLRAEGAWGLIPHDERTRRLYANLKKQGKLGDHPDRDPLRRLFEHLNNGAPRDPMIALQLAHVLEYLRSRVDDLKSLDDLAPDETLLDGPVAHDLVSRPLPMLTLVPQLSAVGQTREVSNDQLTSRLNSATPSTDLSAPHEPDTSLRKTTPGVSRAHPRLKPIVQTPSAEVFLLARRTIRR